MVTEEHEEEKVIEEESKISAQLVPKVGGSSSNPRVNKGKGIVTDSDPSPLKFLKASREVRPDPDGLVLINWEVDGKIIQILNDQQQEYLDKKEQMDRAIDEIK
ncbi:hypothetical protein Tco_0874038 [Tanacetum coccineum]|uniref:Uncharacterized protein n=1 Tax=Tanacetum coccineum TaxID=301880 RepID=A0ABQ5BNC1_9ASTR